MARRGLGKGLSALIPSSKEETKQDEKFKVQEVPLSHIRPNKNQPRQNFKDQSLEELAASIKQFGVIQPILIRTSGRQEGSYEIVAGERRYRASKLAGLDSIPSIIASGVDDISSLEMALIENIHRDNLSPMELAFTYKQLVEEFKITHDQLSERVGKSRTAITNCLRLLALPVQVQKLVDEGKISAGHARALLTLESEQKQINLANLIIKKSLTVRDIEQLVNRENSQTQQRKRVKDVQFKKLPQLSDRMSFHLGAPVKIKVNKKKGKVEISFSSVKDLERIFSKIVGQKA
ncbi:MAG: ParB/RepB/Spo0J family partition protein [Actinomycetia bacterium]|nr:ParB/RepB/Spo0J family partition protein [Actinomycetes bacterium]